MRLAEVPKRSCRIALPLAVLAIGLWGSCGGHRPAVGEEKGNCFPNGTCNAGLSCFSKLCVRYGGDAGIAGGDAIAAGSGGSSDSSDAGGTGGSADNADAGGAGGTGGAGGAEADGAVDGSGGAGGTPNDAGGATGGSSGTGGSVAPSCPPTVDLTSSDDHCGACEYACVHGRHCVAGRCGPAWLPLSTAAAPTPRTRHSAGFVAGQYVVFGGAPTGGGLAVASTAGYDMATDSWAPLAPLIGARCSHEAVSTGTTILTFGGLSNCMLGDSTVASREIYTPSAGGGTWSVVANASPGARYNFGAAWTGKAFFVYGGSDARGPALASGALFSPSLLSWSDASCALAACERGGDLTAFLDGSVVRIWGGAFGDAPAGLAYDLIAGSWSPWTVPDGTASHHAKRHADDGRRLFYLTATDVLSIYDRTSSSWLANDTAPMPAGFCTEAAAVWTGSELVAWSGSCGNALPVPVGGRYQPPAPAP